VAYLPWSDLDLVDFVDVGSKARLDRGLRKCLNCKMLFQFNTSGGQI
jgi:hypothetical protein